MNCSLCQGDRLNWDQALSVRAGCEGCGLDPVLYSWTLFLVNATSKVQIDGETLRVFVRCLKL